MADLKPDLKPHEETWTFIDDGYDQDMGPAMFANGVTFLSAHDWDQQPAADRLRLAAQAPAMARLLLRLSEQMVGLNQFRPLRLAADAVLRDAGVLP